MHPLLGKHKYARIAGCPVALQFNIPDWETLTAVCTVPTGFSCFMFHWQWQQTVPAAGGRLVLLSAGLIISSSTAQHRDALLALENHSGGDVDSSPDRESPVLLTEVLHFCSGEEKTCERVTHGCTHDSSGRLNVAR